MDGRERSLTLVATNSPRLTRPSASGRIDHAPVALGVAEGGHERRDATAADELEQQPQVVHAVADVRLEAADRPADPREHVGVGGARPRGRPRARVQRGQRNRAVARGSGVPAGEREQQLVGLQVVAPQLAQPRAWCVLVLLGDGDVEPAAGEQGQRLLGLGLVELHAQARMVGREAAEDGHDETGRGGLEGCDADRAAHVTGLGCELGLDLLDVGQQLARAGHERVPGVGQLEATPHPAEEPHARLALQLGELLGHRRGREGQGLRRGRDRSLGGEGAQDHQSARGEHRVRVSQQ